MIHHFTAQAGLNLLSQGNVTVTTDKRRAVNVRQGATADLDLLIDMWRRLSARTLQLRYGAPRAHIPETTVRGEMERMLSGDPDIAATLIGTVDEAEASRAVSIVQLVQSPGDRSVAEIAIVVRDDYQREGLGRALCQLVKQVALARGVRTLCIHTLAENQAVMRLIRNLGAPFTAETRRGETTVMIQLEQQTSNRSYPSNFRTNTTAFCPPNPNAFANATSTFCRRA